MKRSLATSFVLSLLLACWTRCDAQTDPKNIPPPPTEELSKFDPFLGEYEVSGDFANLPWSGTLELKKAIKGWYIQQVIKVKSTGIDREFWILATWDKDAKKYRLWGFQTLPVLPDGSGEIRFESNEMVTQWGWARPDGTRVTSSNRYRLVSKDELEIWSYMQAGNGSAEKIGFIRGKRIATEGATTEAGGSRDTADMKLRMPGPDVQNLMLGTWSTQVKYESTPEMPNGGTGSGTEIWRPGPGGLSVIEEYHERNEKGEVEGLGVAWWDAKAQGQRFVWCDNSNPDGCYVSKEVAKWDGASLVWKEEQESAGKLRMYSEVFRDITSNSFNQLLGEGEPGEALKTTVTIRATKLPETPMNVTATPSDEAHALIGTWRVLEFADLDKDGKWVYWFGEHPRGYFVYDATGHVHIQIMKVPPLKPFPEANSDNGKPPTAEHALAAYNSYFAYFGTYTVDTEKHVVTHHVEGSLSPDYTDTEQPRSFQLKGDHLEIGDGKTWRRVLERVH